MIFPGNTPCSYAVLFFIALDFTFITRHIHTELCFCFGRAASFFLELLVITFCSSPIAYRTPSHWGNSWFSVISFCIFLQFMEFSWFAIPSSSGPCFVRSTMTCLSWVTLHGMAHSFIELLKTLCHNKAVIHEGDYM